MDHQATVHISSATITSCITSLITRIKYASTDIASGSGGVIGPVVEGRGFGSSHIQAVSNIQSGADSKEYVSSGTNTWLVTPGATSEYQVSVASGIIVNYKAFVNIQAQSSVLQIDYRSSTHIGTSIHGRTSVRAEANLIVGHVSRELLLYGNSSLTLGNNEVSNVTTAKINPSRWTDIEGVRPAPGYRIVMIDDNLIEEEAPLAVILVVPQYLADTVRVRVIRRFPTNFLEAGKWKLMVPEGTDFNEEIYTPSYFRRSDILSAVMKDFKKFVVAESQHLTERTKDFRKWNQIEPNYLGPLAATMGMLIRLDRFTSETKRRAIHEWIEFCQYAGTKAFIDFEGYILDTLFTIEHLWTNDYRSFIPKEAGIEYPNYYPTNHVAINYDAELFDLNDPVDTRYIYDLFYKLASVPLVLGPVQGHLKSDQTFYIQAKGIESEHLPYAQSEMPANFWIIGMEVYVEETIYDANIMPANFIINAMEHENETIADWNAFEEGTLKFGHVRMVSIAEVLSNANYFVRNASTSIGSNSDVTPNGTKTP